MVMDAGVPVTSIRKLFSIHSDGAGRHMDGLGLDAGIICAFSDRLDTPAYNQKS